jgi:RAB protein geranylgeranyltransferase component A
VHPPAPRRSKSAIKASSSKMASNSESVSVSVLGSSSDTCPRGVCIKVCGSIGKLDMATIKINGNAV